MIITMSRSSLCAVLVMVLGAQSLSLQAYEYGPAIKTTLGNVIVFSGIGTISLVWLGGALVAKNLVVKGAKLLRATDRIAENIGTAAGFYGVVVLPIVSPLIGAFGSDLKERYTRWRTNGAKEQPADKKLS